MYKLELQNIQKKFSNKNVLDGLNLQVKKGERISILGPSGCGKSTTLSIISGLIDDFEGKSNPRWRGHNIKSRKQKKYSYCKSGKPTIPTYECI